MNPTSTGYPSQLVPRLGVGPGVRGLRVVHHLDGLRAEVDPAELVAVGHDLWNMWQAQPNFQQHDLLVGLDAGGIIPTLALALASSTPYKLAWKLDLDLPDKRVFYERHARRTEVFLYGRFDRRRVLIVDDEITTGATAAGVANAVREAGGEVVGVVGLVEDRSGNARDLFAELDIPCCTLTTA